VVHAVTEGIDALGEVTVRIESKDGLHSMDAQSEVETPRTYGGYGADTDIVVASVKAYLSALNKMLVAMGVYSETETSAVQGVAS
jgi:2-isopropylmalate synthase